MDFKSHLPHFDQNVIDSDNPWKASSIFEFHYFCCPECDCKSHTKQAFVDHASTYHTWALNTLKQITDGSLDDIHFPGSNPVDYKDFNIKEESIDEYAIERDNDIVVKNEVFVDEDVQPEYYLADFQDDFDINENDEAQENVKLKSDRDTSSSSKLQAKNSCKKCGKSFKQIGQLKRHWKNCSESDEEEMAKDPRDPDLDADLEPNKKEDKIYKKENVKKDPKKKIRCKLCKYVGIKLNLEIHMEQVHEHSCQMCKKDYFDKENFEKHIATVHEGKKPGRQGKGIITQCELCEFRGLKGDLRTHMVEVHDKKPFKCDICGEQCASTKTLNRHIEQVHDKKMIMKPYVCEICGKSYPQPNKLKLHVATAHEGKKPYKCEECSERFKDRSTRLFHIKLKHTPFGTDEKRLAKYFCLICDKDVHGKITHNQKFHNNKDGDSKCPHCDKTFKKFERANMHIENMHKKTPCTVCGDMYGKQDMKRHILSKHTKDADKKYQCNVCPKGFVSKQSFQDHVNIHTGNKPYICKICGTSFASIGNHRQHERAHMGHKRMK